MLHVVRWPIEPRDPTLARISTNLTLEPTRANLIEPLHLKPPYRTYVHILDLKLLLFEVLAW